MTSGKIRVCILEGHQAELASAGLPFSVCLRLQELGLSMSAAQWSTRQTNTGFSVSIFWPSSTNVRGGTIVDQQKPRSKKRRRRKRKKEPNARTVSAVRDVSPAQDPQNPYSAAASPINAHKPSLSPPPLAATDSSKLPSTTQLRCPTLQILLPHWTPLIVVLAVAILKLRTPPCLPLLLRAVAGL